MTPTPTPAPPIPRQARPAPMYFAATGSMRRAPVRGWGSSSVRSVTGVKGVVEVDAGQDGEDVGLQDRDQEFEGGKRHRHAEGQDGTEPAEGAECPKGGHEPGKNLEGDVPGQHVGEKAHREADRPRQEGDDLDG